MSSEGKVLGTFAMYYREPRSPGEEDFKLIARTTHVAGIALERKKNEEKLRITNEELLSINRIITTTTTTTGVKQILEQVLDEALDMTGLEGGTICMVTPDKSLHLAAQRETSEATIFDLTTNEIKIGECLCGECAKDHKPLILWNRGAVLKYATREATRGEDIRFHAAFPLIIGDRCLGVLCVFTRTDKKPAERSLKLLETITSQIAIAVDNAQMFEKISEHAAILENKVTERTVELETKIGEIERMNRLFVGSELRMVELKEKIKELEGKQ
jgi:formate hydrogenlyase transcriptional activator